MIFSAWLPWPQVRLLSPWKGGTADVTGIGHLGTVAHRPAAASGRLASPGGPGPWNAQSKTLPTDKTPPSTLKWQGKSRIGARRGTILWPTDIQCLGCSLNPRLVVPVSNEARQGGNASERLNRLDLILPIPLWFAAYVMGGGGVVWGSGGSKS